MRNNLALSIALGGEHEKAAAMLRELAGDPMVGSRARRNLALVYALAGADEQAATVARADLKEWQVQNNLVYYGMLRGLSGRDLAAAVFGVKKGFDDISMDLATSGGPS
jgi:Flp pilus assembly protein TadD